MVMRHPADSLFGRFALLFVGVLLISHLGWFVLMYFERNQTQTRYAVEETAFLVEAVRQHAVHAPDQPLPSRVRLINPADHSVPADNAVKPQSLQRFIDGIRERLPSGTDIRVGGLLLGHSPMLWIREPGDARWVVMPVHSAHLLPPINWIVPWFIVISLGVVIAALVATWQLQHPIYSLVQAGTRFGLGQPVPALRERGPHELRLLTRGFNQMVQDFMRTESDRAMMLASIAHDLKTPLTRLRLRAEMMDDAKLHDGVVRDVDSMAHIVDQFLTFAHDRDDNSELVPVEEQCERIVRNYHTVANDALIAVRESTSTSIPVFDDASILQSRFEAGPEFLLPAATLERVLSNLIDNAQAYGVPPIIVATQRNADAFVLSVTDHGQGIAMQDLERASRPFVRLDPARGGNGRSGLGLAIVERLVKRVGGDWSIGNREGAGLCVTMHFPLDIAQPREGNA